MKKYSHKVEGMHCAACEKLVYKAFAQEKDLHKINVDLATATVEYQADSKPNLNAINIRLKKLGYALISQTKKTQDTASASIQISKSFLLSLLMAIGIFSIFLIIERLGIFSFYNIEQGQNIITYIVYGILAGFSSCAALVGGTQLALASNWNSLYGKNSSLQKKATPYLLFNSGRIISFVVLGGLLGYLGSFLNIEIANTNLISIAIVFASLLMLILGLQNLGVTFLQRFRLRLPSKFTNKVLDYENLQGKYIPFFVGILTFFYPCGFTLTAQVIAFSSGSIFEGMIIMTGFVLGTLPSLALIAFGSIKFADNGNTRKYFNKTSALLVVFLALYFLFNQLGINNMQLFASNNNDGKVSANVEVSENLQIVRLTASGVGYSPSPTRVKAGIPIRLIINDIGTTGCTNTIIGDIFGNRKITLKRGENVIEVDALEKGSYSFSCWMKMYWAQIIVE